MNKESIDRIWLELIGLLLFAARYLWFLATGITMTIFMYLMNKTIIVGRKNIPDGKNILIISNHLTMIDSWLISMACIWPKAIWMPHLTPWHLPKEANFMNRQPLKAMCQLWQCIPIRRGSGDFLQKMSYILKRLQQGILMIFPEGTRNRHPKNGKLCRWANGTCHLAYEAKATVIPVAIRGAEDILPIGSRKPKWRKKIIIVIGEPIAGMEALYQIDKKTALPLISDVMKSRLQDTLDIATYLLEKKSGHRTLTDKSA